MLLFDNNRMVCEDFPSGTNVEEIETAWLSFSSSLDSMMTGSELTGAYQTFIETCITGSLIETDQLEYVRTGMSASLENSPQSGSIAELDQVLINIISGAL